MEIVLQPAIRKREITAEINVSNVGIFSKGRYYQCGIPGETTEDGLKRIEAHVLKYKPDIVVIFLEPMMSLVISLSRSIAIKNIEEMIQLIGQEKVVLVSPPYTNQLLRHTDRPLERLMLYRDVTKN